MLPKLLQDSRRGFSYLDVQIAFAVFGIALASLVPIAIAQLRLMNRIENRIGFTQVHYLVPSKDAWARKIGVAAQKTSIDPGSPSAESESHISVNTLTITSLSSSATDDTAQVVVAVKTQPKDEPEE